MSGCNDVKVRQEIQKQTYEHMLLYFTRLIRNPVQVFDDNVKTAADHVIGQVSGKTEAS